jgi:hypothetical protein
MNELIYSKIEEVLQKSELIDPKVSFESDPPRIILLVLSDSFKSMSEAARQEKIWSILHQLPEEIMLRVSFAFTSTQEEEDAQDEADDADEGEGASNPAHDTQGA